MIKPTRSTLFEHFCMQAQRPSISVSFPATKRSFESRCCVLWGIKVPGDMWVCVSVQQKFSFCVLNLFYLSACLEALLVSNKLPAQNTVMLMYTCALYKLKGIHTNTQIR